MAHSHKRETHARGKTMAALLAVPLVLLATGTAVAVGVVTPHPGPVSDAIRSDGSTTESPRSTSTVSRSESRRAAVRSERYVQQMQDAYDAQQTQQAIHRAHEHLWTTAPLNLWTGSDPDATLAGLVDEGKKVLITGRRSGARAELVVDGKARWVTSAYLSQQQPPAPTPTETPSASPSPSETPSASPSPSQTPSTATAPTGLSTAPCPDSSVESGLVPSAVLVYRAVCHAFPQIDTYLGYDPHGEHASGKAIDIMTSDKALGDQIATFLQSHASELDLYDVIWWDRIWTPVRASEGWRDYGDHGSPTANHMDHVHVSTN